MAVNTLSPYSLTKEDSSPKSSSHLHWVFSSSPELSLPCFSKKKKNYLYLYTGVHGRVKYLPVITIGYTKNRLFSLASQPSSPAQINCLCWVRRSAPSLLNGAVWHASLSSALGHATLPCCDERRSVQPCSSDVICPALFLATTSATSRPLPQRSRPAEVAPQDAVAPTLIQTNALNVEEDEDKDDEFLC
jgi:hypothetical protein